MLEEQPGAVEQTPPPEATTEQEVPTESIEAIKAELETLKKEKKDLEALRTADTKRITELKKEKKQPIQDNYRADLDVLNKKIDLLMRHQAGTLPEAGGTLEQQLSHIDAEYQTKRRAIEGQMSYNQHIQQSFDAIKEVFDEIGINILESEDADVLSLQQKFNKSAEQGKPLADIVSEASRVALKKLKGTQPDPAKLKEELKKELHEDKKKSPGMKVDTGTSLGAGLNDDDFFQKWGTGEIPPSKENLKRAKTILDKKLKGG